MNLLDTPPSESFDRITRMASQIFGLPIAAVSLTDRDRQWFKSRVGVEHWSIPREKAPCGEVADTAGLVIIPDFSKHPCYADSLLGQNGIRFYAGAPLVTREGFSLGALCVLGTEPREVTEREIDALQDLAAMVMAQIELQHAFGRIDPLSGLPNRNQFLDDLADLAKDRPGYEQITVLVDFALPEQISSYARVMGPGRVDDVIRDAAQDLRLALGPQQTIYHVAATQFAFLAPADVERTTYIEHLTRDVGQARQNSAYGTVMTSAIGVAVFPAGTMAAQDILRALHSAVHAARSSSDHVSVYSSEVDEQYRRRYRLLQDFGAALASSDQLRLVYQPRIDLKSGACLGAEALLRWRHPVLGDVSPVEFIPIVEHSPHVQAMTAFVLDEALRQLVRWQHDGLSLSVNVSAANLDEPDFATSIVAAVGRHRVDTAWLELEVTESAVMRDAEHARRQLEALSDTGIRLAIDDFGTGYSSLGYLQTLPAKVVKIDQSFVRNLDDGEKERSLVRSMINLSHDLRYRVVAEGVETPQVADWLRQQGCDEAQGYLFSRPLEADQFETWRQSRSLAA
ncbi:sensor domain-containing phosphodiesterase [Mangrovicella endophytica]|uniref:sensor domain-containing phosphodiesterase n=1 Tax=Mangrovicella endophytica TaxID=2066697 RepID=UPI001FE1C35B|nr:sensor domain-containing phosphodiesterase [Mangrovicella endophytica]